VVKLHTLQQKAKRLREEMDDLQVHKEIVTGECVQALTQLNLRRLVDKASIYRE
jgi:hypothetical protein